jgi:hypothetical protein
MILSALFATAITASSQGWTFRTQSNLMGQPEAVAELPEREDAPGRYLRFACSVMTGPVLEAGLGARPFEEFSKFSAEQAQTDDRIALSLRPPDAPALQIFGRADAAQVANYGYSAGGADVIAAARLTSGAPSLTVSSPNASAHFPTTGAANAIAQVLAACPFTG